jgi:hypothetical protein
VTFTQKDDTLYMTIIGRPTVSRPLDGTFSPVVRVAGGGNR